MNIGNVVPLSVPIIQHIQQRLHQVTEDASHLSKEIQHVTELSKIPAAKEKYEALFARARSIETVIQTLKLNFVSLSTLQRKPSDMEQKVFEVTDMYNKEIKHLSESLSSLRKEREEVQSKLTHSEKDCAEFRTSLKESADARAAIETRLEDSCQRINEMQTELLAEKRLRELLEQSHTTAMEQLRELEQKGSDKNPGMHIEELEQMRRQLVCAQEELIAWKDAQKHGNDVQAAMCKVLGEKDAEVQRLQEEKAFAVAEMAKVHDKYQKLNEQLEQLHSIFEEFQRCKNSTEQELTVAIADRQRREQECVELRQQLAAMQLGGADESTKLIEVRERLRLAEKAKEKLETERNSTLKAMESLKQLVTNQQTELKDVKAKMEDDLNALTKQKDEVVNECDDLLLSKQALLDEVNAAAELMDGEKKRLDLELEEQRSHAASLQQRLREYEKVHAQLQERIGVLQQQQAAHGQFERTIADLVEQKNKLAYENGQLLASKERTLRLQAESELLQQQLLQWQHDEKKQEDEAMRLRARCSHLEGELSKSLSDLEHSRAEVLRLNAECRRLTANATSAAMASDSECQEARQEHKGAKRDAMLLSERIEELEAALGAQEALHQSSLEVLKGDNFKITESLQGMITMHAQLQQDFEKVQLKLGRKDGQLENLRQSGKEFQKKIAALEKDLDAAKRALSQKEATDANKVKLLQQSLRQSKDDNSKLVEALQECFAASEQAQAKAAKLEGELAVRKNELARLDADRLREQTALAALQRECERQLKEAEGLVTRERDKVYDRVEHDIVQLQKETEALLEKNSNLQRSNDELQAQLKQSDKAAGEALAQQTALGTQLDYCEARRCQLEQTVSKVTEMTIDLTEAERLKDSYVQKSAEQGLMIDKFSAQIKMLKTQLKEVMATRCDHVELLDEREHQLAAERQRGEHLARQYGQARKRVRELELIVASAEAAAARATTRLQWTDPEGVFCDGVGGEALRIASAAGDAHRYFKMKQTKTQDDLHTARKAQDDVGWNNKKALPQKNKHLSAMSKEAVKMHCRSSPSSLADTDSELSHLEAITAMTRHGRTTSGSGGGDSYGGGSSAAAIMIPEKDCPRTPSVSASESSSRQLEALIDEMERRRLISH